MIPTGICLSQNPQRCLKAESPGEVSQQTAPERVAVSAQQREKCSLHRPEGLLVDRGSLERWEAWEITIIWI